MTKALTGAWVPSAARSALSPTATVPDLPPAGAVEAGDGAPALDMACISRFAAYSVSLFDAVRRCSTVAGASATTPAGERGDAQCEFIVGQPLYVGQNSWVPQRDWQCADPLP